MSIELQQKEFNQETTHPTLDLATDIISDSRNKDIHDLLYQYRNRIDSFEQEQRYWLEKLEAHRIKADEKHKIEWEVKTRREEIAELQKQLSDSHLALYEEREQILKLAKANDKLMQEKSTDSRKISELTNIVEPIEQEVTFFKDCRPETLQKFPKVENKENLGYKKLKSSTKSSLQKSSTREANLTRQGDKTLGKHKTETLSLTKSVKNNDTCLGQQTRNIGELQPKPRNILRTIYLPNEEANAIGMEVDNLKKQAEQEKALTQGEISALKEDRRIREEEWRLKQQDVTDKNFDLLTKLEKSEQLHLETTKELLRLRHEQQQREKEREEVINAIKGENYNLNQENKSIIKKTIIETENAQRVAELKTEDVTSKFRSQTLKTQEHLKVQKEQHSTLQYVYNDKIREMEIKLAKMTTKYNQLEKRRALDMEGLHTDVINMKRRCKDLEDQINRLKKIVSIDEGGYTENSPAKRLKENQKRDIFETRYDLEKLEEKIRNVKQGKEEI